jgi:hypothetical protein
MGECGSTALLTADSGLYCSAHDLARLKDLLSWTADHWLLDLVLLHIASNNGESSISYASTRGAGLWWPQAKGVLCPWLTQLCSDSPDIASA